jgi:hypothetical protein
MLKTNSKTKPERTSEKDTELLLNTRLPWNTRNLKKSILLHLLPTDNGEISTTTTHKKIMDNYVKAYKADQENGEEWREDA